MSGLLVFSGMLEQDAIGFTQQLICRLVEAGDVGTGRVFGQGCLVPVMARSVQLPGGDYVFLGQWPEQKPVRDGDTNEAFLRKGPPAPGDETTSLTEELGEPDYMRHGMRLGDFAGPVAPDCSLEAADVQAWSDFARLGRFPSSGTLAELDRWPMQVRRAVLLAGSVEFRKGIWSLDANMCDVLAEWIGLAEVAALGLGPENPAFDAEQQAVIRAEPSARLLVEAGPGSGKTYVACERISWLVKEGVPSSRIWLLSFTRVAVEEIRRRVNEALQDATGNAINVATFDSLAWQLNASFNPGTQDTGGGYDQAIRRVNRLLKTDDIALGDFLHSLQHVVIDEAQDLVGNRRDMVERLLARLRPDCGVTVLGDFAQAIYGWQSKDATDTTSLQQKLYSGDIAGYTRRLLSKDHRTHNPQLAKLFRDARVVLRDTQIGAEGRYDLVRAMIENSATAHVNGPEDPRFSTVGRPLVLFRGRAPLLSTAHRLGARGKGFSIRLSNRSPAIAPWIGALLAGVAKGAILRRGDFEVLWADAGPVVTDLDADQAWDDLMILSEADRQAISIAALCDRLGRRVPLRFLKDHIGDGGPILSTIHGAKGREADRVLLMLPAKPAFDGDEAIDWDEEARILYVGATRAKSGLFLGSARSGPMRRLASGRMWRGKPADFSAEIGAPGDVVFPAGLAGAETMRVIARRLSGMRHTPIACIARRDVASGRYEVLTADAASVNAGLLGWLSDVFVADLAEIGGCPAATLPALLTGFQALGGTTVVVGDDDAQQEASGLGVLPLLSGFVFIGSERV